MDTKQSQQWEAVFRAIADPRPKRDPSACCAETGVQPARSSANGRASRRAISKHLQLLGSAGLVVTHKDGVVRICHLNAKPLRATDHWLGDSEAYWGQTAAESQKLRGGQAIDPAAASDTSYPRLKKSPSKLPRNESLKR